jgi:hypothetical protein
MTKRIDYTNGTRCFYATPTGLKIGAKGKVMPVSNVLAAMDKGEARRLRKALRAAGETAKAAAPRK